jgi:hypothetical protein
MPSRDLWLSPGHNIVSEGVLMPISALLNGLTITQVEQDVVEYWHIELETHDIVFAEALPAESYLDTGNRRAFINGGDFIEQHPDFMPKHWAETCLTLVHSGDEIRRTKAMLLERVAVQGYEVMSEDDLHVIADGRRIDPVRLNEKRVTFLLPEARSDIELCSRTFVPAHVLLESNDLRVLGICVARLQIDGETVALDDEDVLRSGWHEVEGFPDGFRQRWTTGRTSLPAGLRLLVVDLAGRGYYWREADAMRAGTAEGLATRAACH